jgi:hypothetical protein
MVRRLYGLGTRMCEIWSCGTADSESHNLLERLAILLLSSQAIWGKVDMDQMTAHVTANLEMAMSDRKLSPI